MSAIRTLKTHRSRLTVSLLLVLGVFAGAAGLVWYAKSAEAESLTRFKDVLNDSDLGASASHDIQFWTKNGVANNESITLTFEAGFDLTAVTSGSFTVTSTPDGGADTSYTIAADCTDGEQIGIAAAAGQVFTLEFCAGDGGLIAASSTVRITIGKNLGNGQILNPSTPRSYTLAAVAPSDSGTTRVAIIDDVVVTASVDTTLEFWIEGLSSATTTAVNTENLTAGIWTTATTIPFGSLSVGVSKFLAQELHVRTNARNGFSVTVQEDQQLTSQNGAIIDLFVDGATTVSAVAWVAPSNTLDQAETYGHWGITSEDDTLTGGDPFGDKLFAGDIVQPREVFMHSLPADGGCNSSTAEGLICEYIPSTGKGWTRVGYKIEIAALQEAAPDYTNTLTYVCTPTF